MTVCVSVTRLLRETIHAWLKHGRRIDFCLLFVGADKPDGEGITQIALFGESRQRRKEGNEGVLELVNIRTSPFHAHVCSCFATCLCIYLNEARVVLVTIII